MPVQSVRVVDLTRMLSGPFCSLLKEVFIALSSVWKRVAERGKSVTSLHQPAPTS